VLSIENIVVTADGRRIVDETDLEVSCPGVLCLLGPRRSGKSTLLRVIAESGESSSAQSRGVVRLYGMPLYLLEPPARRFSQYALFECSAPTREMIESYLRRIPSALSVDAWLAETELVASEAELRGPATRLPPSLKRALATLLQLEQEGAIYLVDEPTEELSHAHRLKVLARLAELSRVTALIIATRDPHDCLYLGGETALLEHGRIQEIIPSPALSARAFAFGHARTSATPVANLAETRRARCADP